MHTILNTPFIDTTYPVRSSGTLNTIKFNLSGNAHTIISHLDNNA